MQVSFFKNRIFWSITLYTLVVTVIATIIYYRHREHMYIALDQKLGGLAATVQYVLADDFHDRTLLNQSITPEEDLHNIKNLSLLARQSGITYLYSVIIQNEQIFLTASSASEEEVVSQSEVRYFTAYNEAAHLLLVDDHNREIPKYVTYTDRWGTFRAGLLLRESPSGRPYIAAAEMDVSGINKSLQNELLLTIGYSFLLLAASIPLYLVFFNRLRNYADSLRETNERLRHEKKTRIRLEAGLIQAQKLEAIGTLAGGIAHDFNNLLTAILGNLNLVSFDKTMQAKTRILLASAEKASLRAKDLTQQLLTFAKGGNPVTKTATLKSLITESANFVLHGKNIDCQYDIAEDLWLVDVDKGQISQVIQNLVLNASDAMVNRGNIRISCQNDFSTPSDNLRDETGKRYVRIDIQDFGVGIPEEITTKIFDPFFSTKQQGNGLGLAISHSIITKHHGHISVHSTLGVGTIFTIYLPKSERDIQHKQATKVLQQTNTRSRILVMDDEELVRDLAKAMLNELAQDVLLAKNGEEAIQMYKDSLNSGLPIDLAIMDLTVQGGMGGEEAVAAILCIDPDAKVVVSSGYANNPIMSNFKEYGFVEAITKPYQLYEVSRIIYNFLN